MSDSSYMRFMRQGTSFGDPIIPPKEWYYLKPLRDKKKVTGLAIGVHALAHSVMVEMFNPDRAYIEKIAKEHKLDPAISPDKEEFWGFGPVLRTKQLADDWYEYQFDFTDNMDKIIATLGEVADILQYHCDFDTDQPLTQLAMLDGLGQGGNYMSGRWVSGHIGPQVKLWIAEHGENHTEQVRKSMKDAFHGINRKYPAKLYEFRMWLDRDRFGISVPGNCACFGVDGMSDHDPSTCYQVSPHNMDFIQQQVSILTGYATIWDLSREHYLKNPL